MNSWYRIVHRLKNGSYRLRLNRLSSRKNSTSGSEPSMKLVHFIVFIMVSFFVMFTWVLVLNSLGEDVVLAVRSGGHVIDLQADYDASQADGSKSSKEGQHVKYVPLFQIKGFQYYQKLTGVKPKDKVLRRASKLWALTGGANLAGTIEISDLQRFNVKPTKRWKPKGAEEKPVEDADVVVQIKYYISSDSATRLNVIGVNTKEGEQTLEMLGSVQEPSMLCTKLVYLGPVDIVAVEGYAKTATEYVVVDDLKVAVGVDHADLFGEDAEDMTCESNGWISS